MKKTLLVLSALFVAAAAFAQISVPKVEDPVYTAARSEFKKVVKDIPFEYNSAELKLNDPKYSVAGYDIDSFMKKVLIPALSKLINVLPTDKKVVIDGHANARGPETAADGKMGNVALSQKRAEAVLDYILKNSSISSAKLKVRANGSAKPLAGVSGSSEKNCRVSLDIE